MQNGVAKFLKVAAAGIQDHLKLYLETDGGDEAYFRDMSAQGGDPKSTTLLLRTTGRKTGREQIAPLLYNTWGDDLIIVASKGGFDQHPAWFLNLCAMPDVVVQVRYKRFRCTWRIAEGAERETLWRFMSGYYPAYPEYQKQTSRQIPVVVLTPVEQVEEEFVWRPGDGVDAAMRQ